MTDPIITDESEKEVPAVSKREAAMMSIAAKVDRNELPELEGEGLNNDELEQHEQTNLSTQDDPEDVVTVKVNGEEVSVPRSQVFEAGVRTYQKESAADRRLREAAERERELREREDRLQKMEEEILNKRNQQEEVEIDEESREFADAIFTDEEKVAEHVARLNRKVRDVEKKISESEQIRLREVQEEQERAKNYYHSTYNDIASDEDMHNAFNRRLKTVSAENPELGIAQVIDQAATAVYEKFRVTRKDPPPPPPSKTEIKERMSKQPRTASARKAPPSEQKQQTRQDILNEMKARRGVRSY